MAVRHLLPWATEGHTGDVATPGRVGRTAVRCFVAMTIQIQTDQRKKLIHIRKNSTNGDLDGMTLGGAPG
ncbi:hypothetical protein GCM10022251_20730 [Phytohabitans flavus]|uniref:Uncharacterized protein n=1 Tax=Phytohabitans flavus TaxID=1076124 RepID=A0A6F8XZV7_9ACTN|nr:hypothetical protein Pflav_056710 [Phytohabitans flavus]